LSALVLSGAGLGLGLVLVAAGMLPARPSLAATLARLDGTLPQAPNVSLERGLAGLRTTAGARLAARLGDRPVVSRLGPDLAVIGSSLEALCSETIGATLVGAALPAALWAILAAGGLHLAAVVPAWACLVLGLAATAVPVAALRSQAKEARRHFRRALSSYLDLVVLAQAGGMGVEGALHSAASVSRDWAFRRLGAVLDLARDSGVTPWAALGDLGAKIGVAELVELAASVGLAGTEGAKVRQSLAAKAASLRRHEQAEAESEANAVTERMFVPGVVLLIGFLIFVGFPALSRIFSGL
jgi:hypothetical protein